MKYLISDRQEPLTYEGYIHMTSSEAIKVFENLVENEKALSFDIETNGLDYWVNKPLLYVFSTLEDSFVFEHYHCVHENLVKVVDAIIKAEIRLIGQNIKFDIGFVLTNEKRAVRLVYDTMIADQRIWQKLGLRNNLQAIHNRYKEEEEPELDKEIRNEFIGVNPAIYRPSLQGLDYAVRDTTALFNIKKKQDKLIYKNSLYNLIYKIEFPLISIVAEAEVEGIDFNLVAWRAIYEQNIEIRFLVEKELDEEFRSLRDETELTEVERLRCTGGKFDAERVKSRLFDHFKADGTPKGTDLFGEVPNRKAITGRKAKINFYPKNINYGSDTEILCIFGYLKELVGDKYGNYDIPTFKKTHKVNKDTHSFTTGEPAMRKRMVEFPNSRMNHFIELLLKFRSLNTLINNFGVNYESKINPVTGRLHTVYRQCHAVTGRFQSGGGRLQPEKPNFQNIPALEELRSCFVAPPNYSIITADYSGAELIVMCSLSQDMDLLAMSKRDMHSEIATACWRAVYSYRLGVFRNMYATNRFVQYSMQEVEKKIKEYEQVVQTFVVDKSPERKHLRTAFKPVTFGVIYGLRYKALADSLNISHEEAKIIINTIKKMFPKVIRFVEDCARFAEQNGYLQLNNRTKSKVYFPYILKELRGEISRDVYLIDILKDANEARNIPIQGTQADAIKEASVALDRFFKKRNIDAKIINWVHDEFVIKAHNDDIYKEYELNGVTYKDLGEVVNFIMCDVFNKYLNNVTIKVDHDIAEHWVKD